MVSRIVISLKKADPVPPSPSQYNKTIKSPTDNLSLQQLFSMI